MRPGPPQTPDTSVHLQGLARRIRALRERRGLTQEDFAVRCGISVSFASLLERGERSPSYETLLQVAAALGLPPSELFRLEEDDDTGADRLVHFIRQRQLSREDVDRMLSVAELLFADAGPRRDDKAPDPARCAEPGCGRAVLARGLCVAHYHRARRAKGTAP
ncbi:helix-turn-helix transcriptional regulator [Hyalangium sp.]|uniref:helix-turn-helix domain-containing protein n=1 Tax=Hyalangium sp. TaxID=2028555 RepID=UPI002D4941B5|nr:helix-turn-helix transcriptional regulator [Hyalangium sp.]HYI02675.1 helix-turn-helix transcriptional regulator [Hyalangium sp.]